MNATSPDSAPPVGEISQLAEHLFRHESGKLISVLTGIFGLERLQLAEDVVQEALVRALQTWPYYGVPKNPAAWLTQTAKNLALDVIRREKNFHEKQPQIISFVEQWSESSENPDAPAFEDEIKDDTLRLMFACSHSAIPAEAQTALALKTLCGFSPAEIAKAFLTSEAAIAKRLTRAKQRIREMNVTLEIPSGEELASRLDAVLQTLYLLFNEGYKASSGETLIKEELCAEAIRLTTLLSQHPTGNQPRTHALLALMLLNASRLPAREDSEGSILLLKEQDRSRWKKSMIVRGMLHLGQSAVGSEITQYHLEAGISACHCAAPDYNSTDWPQILSLYDRLLELDNSPVVALNRAVALMKVEGPRAGLKAMTAIQKRRELDDYYLFHAVLGEIHAELEEYEEAAAYFQRATTLTDLKSEQSFFSKRMRDCEQGGDGTGYVPFRR